MTEQKKTKEQLTIELQKLQQKYDSFKEISVKDITERKQAEEALRESKNRVRTKLNAMLLPEGNLDKLELEDILDVPVIRGLMENIFKITGIAVALGDLNGKALIAFGWQDVCTKFHRSHPESCKNCTESDTFLASQAEPDTFKMYKCKNNMWDVASPIYVGDRHMGNLFVGQFFYVDEIPDITLFKAQAKLYGFNEAEYLSALDKVPRVSREFVNALAMFYTQFSAMISNLSYSSIQLARMLNERDLAEIALRKTEAIQNKMVSNIGDVIVITDQNGITRYKSSNITKVFGWKPEELIGKSTLDNVHPDDLKSAQKFIDTIALKPTSNGTTEMRYKRKDGKYVWIEITVVNLLEEHDIAGLLGNYHDISERKQAEINVKESREKLELAIKGGDIGIWEWEFESNLILWDDRMQSMFGIEVGTFGKNYESFRACLHPDDIELTEETIRKAREEDIPYEVIYRVIWKTGEVRYINAKALISEDTNGKQLKMFGVCIDVSDMKQAEETLKEKMNEMQRFHNLTVDRELSMIELKKEVNELLKKSGADEKYTIVG